MSPPPTPPQARPAPPQGTRGVRRDVRFAPLLAGPAGSAAVRRAVSVVCLVAIDVTSVFLGLYAALAFKLVILGDPVSASAIWSVEQKGLPISALTLVLVFAKNGLYGSREGRGGAARILSSVTIATLIVAAFVIASGWEVRTYYIFYASWFLVSVSVIALRASYASVTGLMLEALNFERRALLVGAPAAVEPVAESLERGRRRRASVPYRVVGRHELTAPSGFGAAARLDPALERELEPERVDEVILTGVTAVGADGPALELLDVCRRRGIPVRLAPTTVELLSHTLRAVPAPGLPLFEVRPPVLSGASFYAKRAFDLVVGTLLLLLTAPVLGAAALAIWLYDRGPVIFRSQRVGVNETAFTCLKLRSMRLGAEREQDELELENEAGGAIFKIRRDPRVTPVGRLIRRFSIDELPQLVNVLRGEMSLVGPRPLPVRDYERLDDLQRKRYLVLPGMTGLWQVSGRNELSFDELVRLDFYYIESWSIWLDLVTLARTVPAVLSRRGAW